MNSTLLNNLKKIYDIYLQGKKEILCEIDVTKDDVNLGDINVGCKHSVPIRSDSHHNFHTHYPYNNESLIPPSSADIDAYYNIIHPQEENSQKIEDYLFLIGDPTGVWSVQFSNSFSPTHLEELKNTSFNNLTEDQIKKQFRNLEILISYTHWEF